MESLIKKINNMMEEWSKNMKESQDNLKLFDGALQAAALIKKEAEGLITPAPEPEEESPPAT